MKKAFCIIVLLLVWQIGFAQLLFEDAKGDATIYLNQEEYGWARFNSSSTGINLGYVNSKRKGGQNFLGIKDFRRVLGADLSASTSDGVYNITNSGRLNAGVKVNGLIGGNLFIKPDNSILSIFLLASWDYTKLSTIDTLNNPNLAISDANKNGVKVLMNINFTRQRTDQTAFAHGLSFGFRRTTNYDELSKYQVLTTLKSTSSTQVVSSKEVKFGQLRDLYQFVLNYDFVYLPHQLDNKVGLTFFYRSTYGEKMLPLYSPGLGFLFTKDDEPSSVVGGIGWQFNDIFNSYAPFRKDTRDNNLLVRSTAFFYVGFAISSD